MADHTQPTLERQAEIDLGFDVAFERKWQHFERGVWVFFGVLLALGLAGMLGRGPANEVRRTLPDGTTIRYERIVRFKTPSAVTFRIPANNGIASIQASRASVEKLGMQQIVPQPTRDFGSSEVGPFQFQTNSPEEKSVFVEFAMQPSALGEVTSRFRINGQTPVQITQFIFP